MAHLIPDNVDDGLHPMVVWPWDRPHTALPMDLHSIRTAAALVVELDGNADLMGSVMDGTAEDSQRRSTHD